jgi:hypothetical protein
MVMESVDEPPPSGTSAARLARASVCVVLGVLLFNWDLCL